MIFFGWGTRSKKRQLDGTHVLILIWSIFHVFYVFPIAWNPHYQLATWTESGWATASLTPDQAKAMNAPELLSLNIWERFGLLFAIVGVPVLGILTVFISMFVSGGTQPS